MPDPLVTVVMPSYNHARFLGEAIESVLAQTFSDFELVIIDDCSQDDSRSLIQQYASQDARIRCIFHEHNQGASNFIEHMASYRGRYLAFLNSDDLWEPDKLQKQCEYMESHPDVAACFTDVRIIDDAGNPVEDHEYCHVFKAESRNRFEWLRHFFFFGNAFCIVSLLIRKDAYERYSLDTSGFSGLPDMFIWVRLLMNADVHVYPARLTCFRVHGDGANVSGINPASNRRVETELLFVLREFLALRSLEEIIEVFPEARRYVVDGEYSMRYIMAMMYLETKRPQGNLLAIDALLSILRDPAEARLVERLYGFDVKSLSRLETERDVFPLGYQLGRATVYCSAEGGTFSEERAVEAYYRKPMQGAVTRASVSFVLSDLPFASDVLRFDPIEGEFARIRIVSSTLDGIAYPIFAANAAFTDEDGFQVFYSTDPIYSFDSEVKAGTHLLVVFEIELMGNDRIAAEIARLGRRNDELQAELDEGLRGAIRRSLSR